MAAPSALFTVFSVLSLTATPALGAAARYAAVDINAAIHPFGGGGGGIEPRWYAAGIPATPAQLFSRNPGRVFSLDRDGEEDGDLILDAREAVNQCNAGQHSCVELGQFGAQKCCPNDRYCFLNEEWVPMCCSFGVKCAGSACAPDQRFCNNTIPVTYTITDGGPPASASASAGATTTLVDGAGSSGSSQATNATLGVSYSTVSGCCNRQCGTDSFQCEMTFGGQCCSNGNKCGEGSLCIRDLPPATTSTSVSTIVSEIPVGCTAATQYSCTDGGGCCDTGFICTYQSVAPATSTPVCSPDPNYHPDDGDDDGSSSGRLSNGARVGIGVGIALGAAIVIGALTWFCIRRRKRDRDSKSNVSAHEMQQNGLGPNGTGQAATAGGGGHGGGSGGGGGGLAGRLGRGPRTRHSLMAAGPPTPWTGRSDLSDASGPTISSARPPLHDHGRVYSYFGPTAIAGPFTERDEDGVDARMAAAATTPPTGGPLSSDSTGAFVTPGSAPFNPDFILRPVEIGDNTDAHKSGEGQGVRGGVEPAEVESPVREDANTQHTVIYELMGSLGSPSPLDQDEGTSPSADKTGQSPEKPDGGGK